MKTHLIPCLKITGLTMLLFGFVYPMLITGISRFAGGSGEGVVIEQQGKILGFERIGQSFKSDKYFNGRPSAVDYNAAATGGSNKGPTNPDYLAQVEERISTFLQLNPGVERKDIPVDLVTASGGGLDPNISPAAALVQVPRIAKIRGIDEELLRQLIEQNTEKPTLGILGTPAVHVLRLNIALDETK